MSLPQTMTQAPAAAPPEAPVGAARAVEAARPPVEAARAVEMGRKARLAWEQWFSPRSRLRTILRSIEELRLTPDRDEAALQKRWTQKSFYARFGMDPAQIMARRALEMIHRRDAACAAGLGAGTSSMT